MKTKKPACSSSIEIIKTGRCVVYMASDAIFVCIYPKHVILPKLGIIVRDQNKCRVSYQSGICRHCGCRRCRLPHRPQNLADQQRNLTPHLTSSSRLPPLSPPLPTLRRLRLVSKLGTEPKPRQQHSLHIYSSDFCAGDE
jgi:hypothetical protein